MCAFQKYSIRCHIFLFFFFLVATQFNAMYDTGERFCQKSTLRLFSTNIAIGILLQFFFTYACIKHKHVDVSPQAFSGFMTLNARLSSPLFQDLIVTLRVLTSTIMHGSSLSSLLCCGNPVANYRHLKDCENEIKCYFCSI